MTYEPQEQWQCPECGEWLPVAYGRHVHFVTSAPSLDDMVAARGISEVTGRTADITAVATITTTYWRTGREKARIL